MKGGGALPGLRGKQVSLTLIALICTTFLIWGWERVPFSNVFPADDHPRRVVLPESLQKNSLERLFSGTPLEETSTTKNSSIIVTDGSPSILADKSPPMSGLLSNISNANEDFTTARSSSKSEKDLLGRQSTLKTFHSSSSETAEGIPSATERSPPNSEKDPSGGQLIPKSEETVYSSLPEGATNVSSSASRELANEISPPYSDKDLLGGQSTSKADKSVSSGSSSEEVVVEKSSSLETKVCDYSEGKWVVDSRRPIYSGTRCKRWLSEMWACRLTQRTDFSYEKYRWQPDNCDMPEFNGQEFLKRMQSKTLAFVGDSLGRQQFQSMLCLITGGRDSPDVQDVGKEYGLVRARGAIRPDGWAYRFPKTNTTVLYYWSASLAEIEPINRSDPFTYFAMHLDRPAWFLRENLHRFDVVVLNTGHHWNRGKINGNKWQMYVNGQPNNNKHMRDIRSALNFTVHSVVKWVDGQFNNYPKLRAFVTSLSPRHFFNGDWNTGGRCDNTRPLSRANEALQSRAHDPVAESAVKNTRVELLDITGFSQLRDEAHISKYSRKSNNKIQDCLHWCLPGVPDTWNELLFAQLLFPQGKSISVQV